MTGQHHIIKETTDSLVQLLTAEFKEAGYKRVHILVEAPKSETVEGRMPALCLYLFNLRIDDEGLDSHVHQELVQMPGPDGTNEYLRRAPLWMRLDYLISTWAQTPEDEQLLMGLAIKAIMENPVLAKQQLKGESFEAEFELPLTMTSTLDEGTLSRFWSSLQQPLRPAVQAWTRVPIISDKVRPFRRVEERVIAYRDLNIRGEAKEIGPTKPPDMPPKGVFAVKK
jgi:hypothetical protein